MNKHLTKPLLGVAAAALLVGSTACSDQSLRGEVDDSEVRDPLLVPSVVIGTAREQNDLFHSSGEHYYTGNMTDIQVFGGASGSEQRRGIGDGRNRDQNFLYEQAHEAAWSSYKAADLLLGVLTPEEYERSLLVARAFLNASIADRAMGDNSCEAVYQYGAFGGRSLGNLEANAPSDFPGYDRSVVAGKDSIFTRVIYAAEQAIEFAERGIAAGEEPAAEDPAYFDPENIIVAARGQLAYAHHALATLGFDSEANWAAALENAALVPTDYVEESETDDLTRSNGNWSLSWANDDNSFWFGEINGEMWGSALGRFAALDPSDTRGGHVPCTDYIVNTGPEDVILDSNNLELVPGAEACDQGFRDADETLEISQIPRALMQSLSVRYMSVPLIEGTDMRLIEAERALRQGNLGLFTTLVNEVRTFYNATPIDQPTEAGELEYPNALDDGWSLLDRELLMNESRGEWRRMGHLHRLNHPFVTQNAQQHPYHVDRAATTGLTERFSCFPLPNSECINNGDLECPDLGGG